ncbi:hypothetical protein PHYPSEUDO_007244 [Phytophthora pseudosyringae]|uniref:Uncharacterized protein n=1 Tax=Phytophthora pseudosyringae TaxID=221518 RepID=A0A8T1VJK5_9STRA|nr:hypothetical protein PHYPSEUDO_007244 [Phytophthora pseudosyringae]
MYMQRTSAVTVAAGLYSRGHNRKFLLTWPAPFSDALAATYSPPQKQPPASKMMRPRDVKFVIQQQMKWMRCCDPFNDDNFFCNNMQKHACKLHHVGYVGDLVECRKQLLSVELGPGIVENL